MTESANDSKQTNELKDPYQSLLSDFPEEFLEFARKADLTPPPEMPDESRPDYIRMLKFFRGELVIKKEDIPSLEIFGLIAQSHKYAPGTLPDDPEAEMEAFRSKLIALVADVH